MGCNKQNLKILSESINELYNLEELKLYLYNNNL